ncbi:dihydrofolate reductase family protein [Streptomyces sp. NPDC046876]|uniref:dihydrofolate reductase family protein n=1 Tax=Streptomyces sp. NPDC046876 TaxID=3155616 RepID=UPI0034061D3E
MRKIVLMMSVSLDGFFEGPQRQGDWHVVDDELHRHFNEELADIDGFLHGRVMYELMAGVWPTADADPANAGPMAEFADIWRRTPKYVYSRTLEQEDVGWNSTVVRDVVPAEVAALKAAGDGDLVLGGADIAASFLRQDLVDAYRIYVHPVRIGRGRPLFPSEEVRVPLRLEGTRSFGNGVVRLSYARQ